jgi:hypothetical protein
MALMGCSRALRVLNKIRDVSFTNQNIEKY